MDNFRRFLYTREEVEELGGIPVDQNNLYTGPIKEMYIPFNALANFAGDDRYFSFRFCDTAGNVRGVSGNVNAYETATNISWSGSTTWYLNRVGNIHTGSNKAGSIYMRLPLNAAAYVNNTAGNGVVTPFTRHADSFFKDFTSPQYVRIPFYEMLGYCIKLLSATGYASSILYIPA